MQNISALDVDNQVLKQFSMLMEKGKLAHAYLFVGPDGVGKRETAFAVAKLINCEDRRSVQQGVPCEQCPSCIKVNTKNHPDISIIDSAFGETIKIEDTRSIIARIKLRPFLAAKKVFIIHNIENFTAEAANSLLKTLEEPTDNSLLLLTTSLLEKNFDTIVSRCHKICFLPLSRKDVKESLEKEDKQSAGSAQFLAYFSEGCLGKANRASGQSIVEKKNAIINAFVFSSGADDYIKDVSKDKEAVRILIHVLLSWMRDAILLKAGIDDERIINADRKKEIVIYSQEHSFSELDEIYKEIINANKTLTENLNIKVSLKIIKEML